MLATDATTRALELRRARGLQLAIAITAVVVVTRATPLTRGFPPFPLIEGYAYDLLFEWAGAQAPSDILIVEIDDKSLHELGRFQSWHRDKYAALLQRLRHAQVVAFDILFPEPDDTPVESISASGSVLPADEVFARALREHGRVVLAAHWEQASEEPPSDAHRRLYQRFAYPHQRGRLVPGRQGTRPAFPTPRLAQAAAAVGYVDIDPDPDGVYRRFRPLMVGPAGTLLPHFGTAIAALATGIRPEEVVRDVAHNRFHVTATDGAPRHIGPDGTTLINYCGPTGTVPRVSFADVLGGRVPPDTFQDKIIIVGATAPGLYDIRPAPYRHQGRLFFGVETNANIVNSLLYRRPLRDLSGSYLWGLYALCLGVVVGLLVYRTETSVAVGASLLVFLVLAAPSFLVAFHLLDTIIPYGSIFLGTFLPLIVCLPDRLTAERRLVQHQFGVYVSPEVLKNLMRNPELVRQSQRRQVTLLFSDVRGSTTLSESMPPETWVAQLNEYLSQMSLAIFAYDGYLDKFMGDGIMAVWNAFGTQPANHAELAVRAGLQMLRRLEFLTKKWQQAEDRVPFRIGIGIHSGEAIMGNVGSEDRVQYTAIGDVVNTAARIESMTKQFKVEFIISEATAELLRSPGGPGGYLFPLRELGETEVRGRTSKVKVFEVLQPPPGTCEGGAPNNHVRQAEEGPEAQNRSGGAAGGTGRTGEG